MVERIVYMEPSIIESVEKKCDFAKYKLPNL